MHPAPGEAAADALRALWPDATFTPTEVALLWCLLTHTGRPVSRDLLLHRVWGYAPSVASRTVETTIARVRTKIEPDPARPIHLLTLRGQGYQLNPPRTFAACPPIPRRDPLVGRDALLAELRRRLDAGARLLVLTGPPGIGKTAVARRLLTDLADAGQTVWFTDLARTTDLTGFLAGVARAVGGHGPHSAADVAARLAALQPCVGVLDNLEQLPDEVARCVGAWVDSWPGVRIVGTSHRPLGLEAEQVVPVPPLDAPDAEALVRAALDRRGLRGEDGAVRAVVAGSGGHPLALELAAPSTAVGAAGSWPSRRVDQPERQQTLDALVDRALALLPEGAADALVLGSAFRGPLTPAAAAALWGVDAEAAGRTLVDLAERSLLVRSERGFDVPAALRDPLERRLRAHPLRAAVYERYAEWACADDELEAVHFEALFAEGTATRRLVENGMPLLGHTLGMERCAALLARATPRDAEGRCWLLIGRATCHIARGQHLDEARALLERAEVLAGRLGADPAARFDLLRHRTQLALVSGRWDEAERLLTAAEGLARTLGDASTMCDLLIARLWLALALGDRAQAHLVDEAAAWARQCGALPFVRNVAGIRAWFRILDGDWDGARAVYQEQLEAVGPWLARTERVFLGLIDIVTGRTDVARAHVEWAAAHQAGSGTPPYVAFALDVLDLLDGAPGAREAFAGPRGPDLPIPEVEVRRAFSALVTRDPVELARTSPEARCAARLAAAHPDGLDAEGYRAALGALLRARASGPRYPAR